MARWLLALVWLVLASLSGPAEAQEWRAAPPPEPELHELPVVPAEWNTVRGTFLRVHGPEELTSVLLRVARHGSEALPALATRLEVPIGDTIHVYVAPDDPTFRALQPGRPPTWADATAWPELGVVFLRAPAARDGDPEPLEQVLEHELVHVLLGRAFAPADPPAWLQEGAAQLLAGQHGPENNQLLNQSAALGGLVSLGELERRFPADPRRAKLAYAESADFLAWLQSAHGPEVLPELIRATTEGASVRQAVYAATGTFLEDAEQDWSSQYDAPTATLSALASGEWLWWLGAVALVVAAVRRRRAFHQRLEQMQAEEDAVEALLAAWPQPGRSPTPSTSPMAANPGWYTNQ
jgi:hypothetical protein